MVKSESAEEYSVSSATKDAEDKTIAEAIRILEKRVHKAGGWIRSPDDTKAYLRLKVVGFPYEVFSCIYLTNRNQIIEYEEVFRGTIDGASVFPREIVRGAIRCNAAAVIFVHNHPSGVAEPSQADINITRRLKEALALIDVKVLDHFVVGDMDVTSLAERNQI